jgi:hypothetical protein
MDEKEFIDMLDEQAKNNKIDTNDYFAKQWDNRLGIEYVEFDETEQAIREERMEDWNND